MGIVDATPIAHRIRRPVTAYNWADAHREMYETLAREPYLSKDDAFTVLEAYQ